MSNRASGPTTGTATPHIAPSIHVRVIITWLAITVIAIAVRFVLTPLISTWDGYFQLMLTVAFVVPIAVYLVVPRLMKLWERIMLRRYRSQQRAAASPTDATASAQANAAAQAPAGTAQSSAAPLA